MSNIKLMNAGINVVSRTAVDSTLHQYDIAPAIPRADSRRLTVVGSASGPGKSPTGQSKRLRTAAFETTSKIDAMANSASRHPIWRRRTEGSAHRGLRHRYAMMAVAPTKHAAAASPTAPP